MSHRSDVRLLAGIAAAVLFAGGCGVRAQDAPEILPTPPPAPTATPSADEQSSPADIGSPSMPSTTSAPPPSPSGTAVPPPTPAPTAGGFG